MSAEHSSWWTASAMAADNRAASSEQLGATRGLQSYQIDPLFVLPRADSLGAVAKQFCRLATSCRHEFDLASCAVSMKNR